MFNFEKHIRPTIFKKPGLPNDLRKDVRHLVKMPVKTITPIPQIKNKAILRPFEGIGRVFTKKPVLPVKPNDKTLSKPLESTKAEVKQITKSAKSAPITGGINKAKLIEYFLYIAAFTLIISLLKSIFTTKTKQKKIY